MYKVILAVFTFATIIFFKSCAPKVNPEEEIIRCNPDEVSHIVLEQYGLQTELTKKEDGKFVVNGKEPADTSVMANLLNLPSQLMIKTIAPNSEIDSLHELLEGHGLTISFFNKDKLLCSWQTGTYSIKYKALPLTNTGAKAVFYTELISSEFKPDNYFEIDHDFYINKQILDLEYFEIACVTLNYYNKDSLQSFKLEVFPDSAALYNYNKELQKNINLKAVGQYINYFKNIRYYQSDTNLSDKSQDSIIQLKPLYSIDVESTTDKLTSLKIYPIKDTANNLNKHEAYLLLNNKKPLRIIKYYELDLLTKSPEYFYISD